MTNRVDTNEDVEATSPAPAGQSYGKTTKRIFDSIGRMQRDSVYISTTEHSYIRYEYPTNGVHSKVYSTPTDTDNDGADADDEVLSESWTDGAGRVRFSRVPHTFSGGSTASWAATLTEYDVLGRVTRQSVPTEVDNSFAPTGDDSAFLWTHQKYDWMGRVIRKINTDGVDSPTLNDSDILISYEGCGCAGGQIITAWSEMVPRDDDPELSARRGKRVYSDILGRNFKTENLNWTGGVYSSTMTSFNCRDQVTKIREHEGAWTNPRYQTTSFTYDGHGRMASKHVPQQDPSASTLYTYFADDKPATTTDGRGALTEFTYNTQGLVSQVEYSEPVGDTDSEESIIPCNPLDSGCEYPFPPPTPLPTPSATPTATPTPLPSPTPQATPSVITVAYTYDVLGNRTSMTDMEGNTSYEYDELSRLIAETRQFNDTLADAPLSSNRFKLMYEYELSGIMKSITDPYGDTINYGYDKVGKLDEVTGTTFGNFTNYATSSGYRAWCGLKGLAYGNGVDMAMDYDNRQRPVSYDLKKDTTDQLKKEYEYYADGNIKYIEDLLDGKFDRLNIYDHQGRIKEAKSGGEAREEIVDPEDRELHLPYRQSYGYDQYNNMTQRNNMHWGIEYWYGQTNNLDYAYYNGRVANLNWRYDKDGRVTQSAWPEKYSSMTYDARGLLARVIGAQGHGESDIYRFYDGDGREVKRKKQTFIEDPEGSGSGWQDDPDLYFIRSSVLGGQVVSETWPTGKKKKTFVFAAGAKIATQTEYQYNNTSTEGVYWHHNDASDMSYRSSNILGDVSYGEGQYDGSPGEKDPIGNNMGVFSPYFQLQLPQPPDENFPFFPLDGESPMMVNGQQVSCELDGMSVGCSMAMQMLESGSAVPAALAWYQQNVPGFRFQSHGLGIFTFDVPKQVGWRVLPNERIIREYSQYSFDRYSFSIPISWGPSRQTTDGLPIPKMNIVRDKLIDLLDKDSGKCRGFLDSVRSNLKIKESVEELFDKLISKGGEVVIDSVIPRSHGRSYWGKGGKNIGLGPVTDRWERYLSNTIHELFHRAGKGHSGFARAAYESLPEGDREKNPYPEKKLPGKDMDDTYSSYFTSMLNKFCPPF